MGLWTGDGVKGTGEHPEPRGPLSVVFNPLEAVSLQLSAASNPRRCAVPLPFGSCFLILFLLPSTYCSLPTVFVRRAGWRLTLPLAGGNLESAMGAYRFRREALRLGGMPGVHTTRNRRGSQTTANTQYAYAA